MREKLMQELEEERGLRLQSERRLQEVAEESDLGRAQMVSLQQHFSRMEETVRSLLQNQGALEHTAVDTVDLMKAYKDKLSEEVRKRRERPEKPQPPEAKVESRSDGDADGGAAEGDGDKETRLLLERMKALEAENSALASENESQREQYERCLDEVANQVVQALLTQKDLREECLKLRTRVFDLEQQNRTLSVLFQQRVRPASDMLLQKLHSKIMGLSAGDLSLESERSKSFLLSRNTDSPPHDSQLNGKAGLPVGRCPSLLSLTVPMAYPRSSCSSSELSISSACSEFSSSSYTWNEGKLSSLTWEKRGSLGSSAPGNICAPPEEQPPTWRKECHILEGLKRLQRRRPKESPPLISKSGYKDCMNSNEGIYSLGLKCGGQGTPKPPTMGKPAVAGLGGGRKFTYDSDDADDESSRAPPGGDHWVYSKKLTHSLSDSLCRWEEGQGGGDGGRHAQTITYDCKERPEKLIPSILGSFLSSGRTRAALGPSLLPFEVSPIEVDRALLRLSDTDEAEDLRTEIDSRGDRPERDARLPPDPQCERRSHGRARSADSRPRPLSLLWQQKVAKTAQSEESIAAIFDADGEPIELSTQHATVATCDRIFGSQASSAPAAQYTELVPPGRLGCQREVNTRNYSILESPEKPAKLESPEKPVELQPHNTVNKTTGGEGAAGGSGHLQERSPSSPPVKLSRFIKPPGGGSSGGCSQSSKVAQASSRVPGRTEWAKGPSSSIPGSPLLSRRHVDYGEQPTRDGQQLEFRSPSPPPPPGRTTSLLIRPNYDGSPQAPKAGVHPPVASTVRGHPPISQMHPHHPLTALNTYKDGADPDADHSTDASPQKLVDGAGHYLQKSPAALSQTPTQGSPKRGPVKLLQSSSASGHAPEPHESMAKSSRNLLQKGSSLQSTLGGKKAGPERESGYPMPYKTSGSLPASLQAHAPCVTDPHAQTPQAVTSSTCIGTSPQNSTERATKTTRIPMGFKVLVKSPPAQRESSSAAAKQDKDHVNVVCKGTSTSGALDPRGTPPTPFCLDAALGCSKPKGRTETHSISMDQEPSSSVLAEQACEQVDGESRLFKRSISVTTKPHLKPALGMNGAKARSQSFSTNYIERPNIMASDGPGKIRTQIITNTGERGNSLTRQSSLGDGFQLKPTTGLGETPNLCAFSRSGPHGAVSSPISHIGLPAKSAPKASLKGDALRAAPKGEASLLSPQKEVRSPPLTDRFGLKNSRQLTRAPPHPQPESPSSSVCSPDLPPEGAGSKSLGPSKLDSTKNSLKQGQRKGSQQAEKLPSPTACTIEEKVMMGIQENVQRGQGQEKTQAPEAKQKTGPSLANWFGLRKSKLPALGGKKADTTKGKEEKKELKIGSVLGSGKQSKPDKKKEKKKNEMQRKDSRGQAATENSDKLGLIMDRCSVQVGQVTNQIQHSTSYVGKDLFMKELLNRNAEKGDSHGAPLPSIPAGAQGLPRNNGETTGDSETHSNTVISKTKIFTQKINLKAENEEDSLPEATCQDHMIGSSCQMRTLDSGIGTFPFPDSVARATGRHLPKSASSPERALATPANPLQDPPPTLLPRWKVPSRPETCLRPHSTIGTSLSDPTMTESKDVPDPQSRLPKPTTSGGMNPKRPTQNDHRTSPTRTTGAHDNRTEKRKSGRDHHALPSDRALHVCTYSSSSGSEVETEPEDEASVTRPSHESPPHKTKKSKSVEQEGTKRSSVGNRLSIMDFYQQEVFAHYEKEEHRAVPHYNSPGTEDKGGDPQSKTNKLDETTGEKKKTGFSGVSLESLNKINSNSGGADPDSEKRSNVEKPPREGELGRTNEASSSCSDKPGVDNLGSLSDSLYDSFSSCASQGSNDV
ncbi:hypothetical protein AAFF_G00009180 [Aldrovandia affinis]|uniref:Nck-associated protein 5 C-terminal domain-containing protein n=1 Tax=Aldrovandia affinis TaxID=143900 RepID=A0AAD7T6F1_9TELE|nr:hypothetical protein AAFF_G00009180 [Aldrovandia affinis]